MIRTPKFEVRPELAAMKKNAFRVKKILLSVLKEEGVERLHLRPSDQMRLGILRIWSERHKVPIRYILQVLRNYWQQKTRRPGKKSLLGVTLAAFTSSTSEQILVTQIQRDFPGGENVAQRQLEKRQHLLNLDAQHGNVRPLVDSGSQDDFLYKYSQRVERRQRVLDRAASSDKRRRRKWRGNPW